MSYPNHNKQVTTGKSATVIAERILAELKQTSITATYVCVYWRAIVLIIYDMFICEAFNLQHFIYDTVMGCLQVDSDRWQHSVVTVPQVAFSGMCQK